jgi:hypothetical protein
LRIFDEQEKELYSSVLPSTQEGGIMMIKLSEKLNSSLPKVYKWKFSLVDKDGMEPQKFTSQGWIEKVPLDSNLQKAQSENVESWTAINILAEKGIWQDTVEELALLHLENPNDSKIEQAWTELFKSVGLERVAKKNVLPYIIQVP